MTYRNLNYPSFVEIARQIEPNLNPPDHDKPEMFCSSCQSFTTSYNWRKECKEHGTTVTEDVTEVEIE